MAQNKINILVTARDKASGPLSGIKGALGGIGTVAGGIIAANLLTKIGDQISNLVTGSLDGAKNMEQLEIAFTTMLKSGDKAGALLKDITAAAKETPFELPELQDASKSLLAFGIEADSVVPTLKRLGDVSAGIGANVGEIAQIYGKARVQGRLFAEDINQLTGRGIPIIGELAKQFGVAESEVKKLVEDGKVGFPQLEQAFKSMTSEGGQFEDLMKDQANSLEGIQSNISDTLSVMSVEILRSSGLFDVIKNGARSFLSFLEFNSGSIQSFFTGLVQGLVSAGSFFTDLIDLTSDFGAQGQPIFRGISELVKVIQEQFAKIAAVAVPVIKDFIAGALPAMQETLRNIGPYVLQITRFFGELVGLFGDLITNLLPVLGPLFESGFKTALSVLQKVFKMLGDIAGAAAKAVAELRRLSDSQFGQDVQKVLFGTSAKAAEDAAKNSDLQAAIRRRQQGFARGGDFVTNGPMSITVGDNPGGRERVQVTPISSPNFNGPQGRDVQIVNNFNNTRVNEQQLGSMLAYQLKIG